MRFLVLIALLIPIEGKADCNPAGYYINDCENSIRFKDPNQALHMIGAAGSTLITALILHKAGLTKTESMLLAGLINYTVWTAKEFYIDEFPAKANNSNNLIGVGAGMLIAIPLF